MRCRFLAGAMLLAAALPLAAADGTGPVITPNVSGTAGQNGWFVSDVTLTWTVADDESPVISTSGCDAVTLTVDDTMRTYTCVATSAGGTSSASYVLGRDTTPPVVSYLGFPGTYRVDWGVAFPCQLIDVTSGVASTTCIDLNGNAYDFPIGVNTYTSTATDFAGNTGTGTLSFEVIVDAGGMSALVDRFVSREHVARNLKRKLTQGHVDQFIRAVERERGDNITDGDANTLIRLAGYL
jgi:hypothetical protein